MIEDIERMLICDVCGAEACCGFGVTVEGIRMGDVGSWRCAEHHAGREQRYTREDWAQARAEGLLYPRTSSYVAKINTPTPADQHPGAQQEVVG